MVHHFLLLFGDRRVGTALLSPVVGPVQSERPQDLRIQAVDLVLHRGGGDRSVLEFLHGPLGALELGGDVLQGLSQRFRPHGLFEKAGLINEDGTAKIPATWEELRAAAAATTDAAKGTYGYGCPIGDSWYYLALMLTAGGQVYNEEGNNIGFHNEAGTKPLQLWLDMVEDGSLYLPDGDDYASNAALRNSFMAGICNITMQSSAQYRSLADNSEFEVGVAYIPKDVTYAAIPGGSNIVSFGTNLSEEEQQAVWTFMKYMCSGDVAGKYAAGTGYLPTSDAALNSEIYQEMLAQYPFLDIAVGQLEYFVNMPFDETYTEVKDSIVGKYVQEVIINGMSPEDAVDAMFEETGALY